MVQLPGAVTHKAEIEEKRRVVVEQPTAPSVDGVLPGGKIRRQSQGAEAAGAASVCGGSIGNVQRSWHLPHRLREQQRHLPPDIRNQDVDAFLVTLQQLHACFRGPQVTVTPHAQATQSATAQKAPAATIPATLPSWRPRDLVQLALLMATRAAGFGNKSRRGPTAYRSCSRHASRAVVKQRVPVASQMATLKMPAWAASSAMRNWSEFFESIDGAEDRSRVESARGGAGRGLAGGQEAEKVTKKTQWVVWSVNSTELGPIKKWLPEACNADFLPTQESHLPKHALFAEESWMGSQVWRAYIAPALFGSSQHGEWVSTMQTARSKGSAEVMVAVALRHGLATPHCGAGDRGIELCKGRVLAHFHSGSAPGGGGR